MDLVDVDGKTSGCERSARSGTPPQATRAPCFIVMPVPSQDADAGDEELAIGESSRARDQPQECRSWAAEEPERRSR